jgi:P27 family predicted phage terminase small subunit
MSDRATDFEPPEHLSESSKALWRDVVPARGKSVGRLALIAAALEARDRADEARQILLNEGLFSQEKGAKMAHLHPAYRVEKESRAQFVSLWRELGMAWNQQVDGR